jgi:hypothetical protein
MLKEYDISTNFVARRERSDRVQRLQDKLENSGVDFFILPQEVHEWCINLIRHPDKRFSFRSEKRFPDMKVAIEFVRSNNNFGEMCIVFGYNIDIDASICMRSTSFFDIISSYNTIFSMDGIVVTNVHVTSGYIFDFEDADDVSSLGNVHCSILGELALGAQWQTIEGEGPLN